MRIVPSQPVVAAVLAAVLLSSGPPTIRGVEENDSKNQPASPDTEVQVAERNELREKMIARIEKVAVSPIDAPKRRGQLVSRPLMTYTDEPLAIDAATVWTWASSKDGRPIAICKVEHYDMTRRPVRGEWLYCFASVSADLLSAEWPDGHKWASSKPGVSFRDIPDAPMPGTTRPARLRQMKDLSRRFAGAVEFGKSNREELRLLPQPVYSYSDSEAGTIDGAVFGAVMNGTNPTALFLIELQQEQDRQLWRFAVGAMTDAGVVVRFDGQQVWSKPELHAPGRDFETWTYFFEKKQGD